MREEEEEEACDSHLFYELLTNRQGDRGQGRWMGGGEREQVVGISQQTT